MNHEYNQRVDKRLDSVLILKETCATSQNWTYILLIFNVT